MTMYVAYILVAGWSFLAGFVFGGCFLSWTDIFNWILEWGKMNSGKRIGYVQSIVVFLIAPSFVLISGMVLAIVGGSYLLGEAWVQENSKDDSLISGVFFMAFMAGFFVLAYLRTFRR